MLTTSPSTWLLLSPLLWLSKLPPSVDLESTNDSDQLNRKALTSRWGLFVVLMPEGLVIQDNNC